MENWIEFECLVIMLLKIKKGVLEAECLWMDLADVLPKKHLRKLLGLRDDILGHLFGSSVVERDVCYFKKDIFILGRKLSLKTLLICLLLLAFIAWWNSKIHSSDKKKILLGHA